MNFEAGTIVYFKLDSRVKLIVEYADEGDYVFCLYLNMINGEIKQLRFHKAMLSDKTESTMKVH